MNTTTQQVNTITFTDEDDGVIYLNIDPLVISAKIMGVLVHHLLINNGALFNNMLYYIENFVDYIEPCEHMVKGLGDTTVKPYGIIELAVELIFSLSTEVSATCQLDFILIDLSLTFNGFLGKPSEHEFGVATSTHFLLCKIPHYKWGG